jgi:regulator of protease activity HflC (stomatin/prohibitin superfamily)
MKRIKFLLMALFCVMCMGSCTIVDSGEVGIKFHKWSGDSDNYGGVDGTCSGWVFYNPLTTDVFTYPTIVLRHNYEPFTVNAKDASTFTMDPQIAYHIDPNKACQIFTKYRKPVEELESGYIRTCIYEAYRTCANAYTSDSLMSHRAQFEADVRNRLEKSLIAEGFIVDEFTSAIKPPQSLEEMINAKNKAVQAALKAENEVKEAEANAKIAIAKAKGTAEAKKIAADGEAYANAKIAQSINPTLVQKMWVEKWNGIMPETVAGSNAMFMLGGKK